MKNWLTATAMTVVMLASAGVSQAQNEKSPVASCYWNGETAICPGASVADDARDEDLPGLGLDQESFFACMTRWGCL